MIDMTNLKQFQLSSKIPLKKKAHFLNFFFQNLAFENVLRLRGLLSSESIEEYQPHLAKVLTNTIGKRYDECLSQIILSFLKKVNWKKNNYIPFYTFREPPTGHCVAILATYESANVAQDDLQTLYGELLSVNNEMSVNSDCRKC